MKRTAALLLALVLLAACLPKEPDARVLFVGNSYTFYNDLPRMVSDLAGSEISLTSARGIRLHQPDKSHPTLEGSYLAALVIAATITGESPEDMTDDLEVPTAIASLLREYAISALKS